MLKQISDYTTENGRLKKLQIKLKKLLKEDELSQDIVHLIEPIKEKTDVLWTDIETIQKVMSKNIFTCEYQSAKFKSRNFPDSKYVQSANPTADSSLAREELKINKRTKRRG